MIRSSGSSPKAISARRSSSSAFDARIAAAILDKGTAIDIGRVQGSADPTVTHTPNWNDAPKGQPIIDRSLSSRLQGGTREVDQRVWPRTSRFTTLMGVPAA